MSTSNAFPSADYFFQPHQQIIDAVHVLERGITIWLDNNLPLCADWTEQFLTAAVSVYVFQQFCYRSCIHAVFRRCSL